ncbi:hypothetical protein BJV78DRAFT_1188093, partial [Lactifluus subvellereus]
MKFSAINYHMQYSHDMSHCPNPLAFVEAYVPLGIAASTARPRPGKLERTHMLEGQCHLCARWVPVQGVEDANAK